MACGAMTYDDYRSLRRFPALDGLRAVSIVLVIFAHSRNEAISFASQGINGVVLFFVLSGFLITSLALREEARYGAVSLRAFMVRRAFRILPLYYAALAGYAVLVLVLHVDPREEAFRQALPYYLFFFQEHVRFAGHGSFTPFEVSWSLGIEEKFYLVWPVLAFVALRHARNWRVPVAAFLAVLSATAPMVLGRTGLFFLYYSAILCGCLIALLLHHRRTFAMAAWFGTAPGLVVGALLTAGGYALTYAQYAQAGWVRYLCVVALFPCFAVLVAGLVTTRLGVRAVFDWRPVVIIGQASYAAYLLHLIFLNGAEKMVPSSLGFAGDLVAIMVGMAATFAVSIGVQRWFEGPITVYGHRLAGRLFPRMPVVTKVDAIHWPVTGRSEASG
jgi:peptidoglycan/LPS O-acetylase OafA/YrhL